MTIEIPSPTIPNGDVNSRAYVRNDWSREEILSLFSLPFNDLLFHAQKVHRENFNPNEIQLSTLLSIKTGGCAEDCGYCSQSAHYETGLPATKLMPAEEVIAQARKARDAGASRYCMGAAWRNPKDRHMAELVRMIEGVRDLGMETCMTLGMLEEAQAEVLKEAGLDYYNHNIDTSREFYGHVITTRSFDDRLDTLEKVRDAGIKVCSGGIVGLGESRSDRAGMLRTLANLPVHPDSVPINMLVQCEGTPLAGIDELDHFEFIRTIAVARITMPRTVVRLSAGRESMNDQTQALCFMAGANSIFVGEELLTTPNPSRSKDRKLLKALGITGSGLDASREAL